MSNEAGKFNLDKFRRSEFVRRKGLVKVPSLTEFFDGEPLVEVQGLSGVEVFKAEERQDHNKAMEEIVKAFSSATIRVKVDAAMEALGIVGDSMPNMIKAVAFVEMGTISIKFSQADVIKFARSKFSDFWKLFTEISRLTDLGFVSSGELNATGTTHG